MMDVILGNISNSRSDPSGRGLIRDGKAQEVKIEPLQVPREMADEYHFKQLLQPKLQLLFCG
mgnify:CR=1 FL=1